MPYLLFLKKRQNLELSFAVNYRLHFMASLFAYWVILQIFLLSTDFFIKINISKNSLRNTIRVSNILDPDQADILLGLIWVQTFCNSYQQINEVGNELTLVMLNIFNVLHSSPIFILLTSSNFQLFACIVNQRGKQYGPWLDQASSEDS